MKTNELSTAIVGAVLKLIGIAFGVWLLIQLNTLIIYLGIAAVVSLIGRPINLFFIKRLRFNSMIATTVTITSLVGIIAGILSLFFPLLLQQGENLSLLDVDLLEAKIGTIMDEVSNYFQLDNTFWEQQIDAEKLFNNINLGIIPEFLNKLLEILGGFTMGLFSVLFISFFFLKDSGLLERMITTLVKDKIENRVDKSIEKIKNLLSRYFLGLVLQISILLIIYTVVLLIFGIKNAFVIAFLCSLLNLIPYIGPLIGGVLMLLLTMSSNIDSDFSTVILPKTIYVMIGFVIGQLIDNFFSQPFIFSNSVKSHPLEIFIVILSAGVLLGPLGMIIAIPIYTALRVILKEFLSENKIVKSLTKDL